VWWCTWWSRVKFNETQKAGEAAGDIKSIVEVSVCSGVGWVGVMWWTMAFTLQIYGIFRWASEEKVRCMVWCVLRAVQAALQVAIKALSGGEPWSRHLLSMILQQQLVAPQTSLRHASKSHSFPCQCFAWPWPSCASLSFLSFFLIIAKVTFYSTKGQPGLVFQETSWLTVAVVIF